MEKKILILTPYFNPEPFPINTFVNELIERDNISEVKVITCLPNYRKYGFYKGYSLLGPYLESYKKLKILRLPIIPRLSNSKFFILLFYFSFFISSFIFMTIFSIFNRNKYNHILTFCGSPVYVGFIGYFASKLLNTSSSQWIQDIWPEAIESTVGLKSERLKLIISNIQNLMWNLSDTLFSESESLTKYLKKNIKNKKIVTLYNPIRLEIKNFKNKINKDNKELTFSYVGNIGEAQKIELIVESFILANLKECVLNICGDGSLFKKLSNIYKSNNIKWHGWIEKEKLDKIYSESDYLILGLESKGRQGLIIPSKIQSYFMNKKPVISISPGSISDLVQDNNAGISCKTFDKNIIKITFEKALSYSNEERNDMGENAYKYYLENFTKEKIVNQFLMNI